MNPVTSEQLQYIGLLSSEETPAASNEYTLKVVDWLHCKRQTDASGSYRHWLHSTTYAWLLNAREVSLSPAEAANSAGAGVDQVCLVQQKPSFTLREEWGAPELPTGVMVKLDLANAFNSCQTRRNSLTEYVSDTRPQLHKFVYASHACDSKLTFGTSTILSL